MRKVLSLLLCVAMLCSLVVITAQADATPAASFADVATIPGGSVTIDMNVANNPGLAAIRFTINDEDDLGVTYEGVDNGADTLGLTANDGDGIYYWSGSVNNYNTTIGKLTITIPDSATTGTYNFSVVADQGANGDLQKVTVGGCSFKITVTDKVITGVNVAIDAGLAIGIHVAAINPADATITAVDVKEKEYMTLTDPEIIYGENEEPTGEYIFYMNVNPWDMDREFTVDFTSNFTIKDEILDLGKDKIPTSARTIGILSYCNAVKGVSEELDQLIADLLEFGRQAQIFQGETPSYSLPAGLTASEAAWEIVDPEDPAGEAMIPADFDAYCSENYPETIEEVATGNATNKNKQKAARGKFKFDSAEITLGSKFVVKLTIAEGTTVGTSFAQAHVVVNGGSNSLNLEDNSFTYAFSPVEFEGIGFDLYAGAVTSANWGWTNTYGPAHYAAYLYDTYCSEDALAEAEDAEAAAADAADAAEILAVLEAFCLYGLSVQAYAATLGE